MTDDAEAGGEFGGDGGAEAGGEVGGDDGTDAEQGATPDTGRTWDEYYRGDEWEREAGIAGTEGMTKMASRFIDMVEPRDFASVGCGPAAAEFELAERYPDVDFYGYARSPAIIEDDRREAEARGLDNIPFAVDSLPGSRRTAASTSSTRSGCSTGSERSRTRSRTSTRTSATAGTSS